MFSYRKVSFSRYSHLRNWLVVEFQRQSNYLGASDLLLVDSNIFGSQERFSKISQWENVLLAA